MQFRVIVVTNPQTQLQTHTQTDMTDYNTLRRSYTRSVITGNSAVADKPRDTFRGQSRSPNMVPLDMLGMVSYVCYSNCVPTTLLRYST